MDNAFYYDGLMVIGDGSNTGNQCPTGPGGQGAGQLLQGDIEVRWCLCLRWGGVVVACVCGGGAYCAAS